MSHAATNLQGALAALARVQARRDDAELAVVQYRVEQALCALGYPVQAPQPAQRPKRRGVGAGVAA